MSVLIGPQNAMGMLNESEYPWVINCLMYAIKFAAAMAILLQGIRMFISELLQILMHLSRKFVTEMIPGVDASAVMSYSPKAWMTGFGISYTVGVVTMILMIVLSSPYVVIIGVGSHFFAGGVTGVFGHATGGKRGAIVAAIVTGVLISVLPALLMPHTGEFAMTGAAFGETEYGVWGTLFVWIIKLFGTRT